MLDRRPGNTIVIAQDQEQVDKVLSVRDHLPNLASPDEMRGLNDYDEPDVRPSPRSCERPRRARRSRRGARPRSPH